ncbi:nuclear transport factor 2 family protein [Maribellus mangrovi]|uniref:nuclear transport factor 2 family protein n=1 Tax=Maribellus mangrovi TaxID=3133146 RepID=UPI0030EB2FF8
MGNLDLLKEGYQKFAEHDIEAVTEHWKADIHWHQCTGFPFVTNNGTYVGKQAIVEGIFANIPVHYDNFNIEIDDFVDGGDKIVMVGHYTGTWKATGKKFRANATHVWTFEKGQVSSFFQAADTAEIMNP